MGGEPVRKPAFTPFDTASEDVSPQIDERPSQRAYVGQAIEPPAGWRERSNETPGDLPPMDAMLAAAWENQLLNGNTNADDRAMSRAYNDFIHKARAAGLNIDWSPYSPGENYIEREGITGRIERWHDQVNQQLANNPKLAEALGPISRETIAELGDQISRDAFAKYNQIKEARGEGFWSVDTLAEFGVSMGGSLTDPTQAATTFVGGGAKTIAGAFVKGAAINGAVEAALQPAIIGRQIEIGNIGSWEEGLQQAGQNVLFAAAVGGVLDGTVKLGEKGYAALPGVKRDKLMRGWLDELGGMQFNDAAIQSHVMGMISDQVENGGPVRMTHSMAAFLRDAAAKTTDAKAAARLGEMAQQVEDEAKAADQMPESFDKARSALATLSTVTEETDPEAAALIRKAAYDAERDFETARQAPEGVERDQFFDAVEQADAKLRGLTEILERPEARRPDPPRERLDTSDDAPTPRVGDQLVEDGRPVTFTSFDPRKLGVAPDEFQYKKFNGAEGVNDAIADVETWHAPSSGKILVFERANGELVVADGHQRRSKALGLMTAQGRDDIKLDGYLYREADGWTVADMRLKGAQKNIREGRSDVLDTAQALRESPNAIDSSFPVSRSNIRQARQLARLSDDAWDLTRAGVLEPQYAALIGAVAPDRPAIHAPLARTLIEAAPDNIRQAENIVSEALLDYAERSADTQASLFGDDNLGRAVMYKERAQIMDAAYAWLRSERSVFKALVDKGDIARALGNELVDAANLTAKDQVELAIAAVMHSRKAGVRTAVTDMITRALDSVRREGVSPTRAGQQVAREIRALVDERGFRALLDAEGPRPPDPVDSMPLFDGPGSKAHAEHADALEGELHPEGTADPGVKLADALKTPDEVTSLVDELKGAGQGGGDRTPDQILEDIRALLSPKKEGAAKPVDPVKEAQAEFQRFMKADSQLRDMLVPLTDAQKVALVKMQYPDAYPWLNRLEGADLDEAIVGRVMAGDVKFARQGDILVLNADQRVFSPGQPDNLGFITSAERALGNPPARFRDAKALTADQWRKLMKEGGASKEAFTYQIEPALKALADEGLTGDIPKAKFEEALARNRTTMRSVVEGAGGARGPTYDEPGFRRENDYSAYVAPGKASGYRQEVLTMPGLDYKSHNWNSQGAIGHIRTTQRVAADGRKVLHVEELQSDLHQEGAKQGYRDGARAQSAGQAYDSALDAFQKANDRYKAWRDAQPAHQPGRELPNLSTMSGQDIFGREVNLKDATGRELYREAQAAFVRMATASSGASIAESGVPRAPMQDWEEPFVRHVLQTAAKDGVDTVTFPTWSTLHSALQNEGTKKFYDQRLPNTLARVAKSLGLKVEMVDMEFGRVTRSKNGIEPIVPEAALGQRTVPAIRLTPEAKAKLAEGAVMYSRGEWTTGMSPEGVVSRLKAEFGDGATALVRVGELNIAGKPPVWAAPDTMGLTDARGRVTLFAGNMDPGDVRGLVLHEVGVHAGLENVLGAAGKAQLLNEIVQRMRAAAPDHALLKLSGVDPAPSRAASSVQFEPIANAAARDLVDLSPDQWAGVIADNRYAAYLLPDGSEDAKLPRGYEMVRSGDATYAVRSDHLRERQAAGARVTLLSADDKAIVAAMNRVPLDTDPAHVAEETLAYLVQHAPKSGIVQRLLADIRAWIYRTFPKMRDWMTLTDNDLVSLALGAVRQRVQEANWSTPVAHTKNGAPFFEPILSSRRTDEFGLPVWPSGYEPRDLILMFNDGLTSGRMAVELGIALGHSVEPGTLETRLTHVRTALRAVQKDPEKLAALARKMAVSVEELDTFVDNIGHRRAPSLRAEAKRLISEGETDRAALMRELKAYAGQHRLEFKESSLGQIISQIKGELGKSTSDANTVTTPEQRDQIVALRKQSLYPAEIAAQTGVPLRGVRGVLQNARARQGMEFPPLQAGVRQPISTGPIKYARRPRNGSGGSQEGGGTEVPGGAGRPGQPDVGRDVGAVEGAAQRGAVGSEPHPGRALATEPLPKAPADAGLVDWNERFKLDADQRAARREQFRDFVDNAEIVTTSQRFMADWGYRNGRMVDVGRGRMADSVAYHVSVTPEMHASWAEALDLNETAVRVEIHAGEAIIPESHVADAFRSTGLGTKLYMRAIDDMLAAGLIVNSDVNVSENAIAMWKSLRAKGYDVVQRVPDSRLERGEDGMYSHMGEPVSVFFIARKQPPTPDLPISDRDLSNQINEARDLSEHIPACIKGKK